MTHDWDQHHAHGQHGHQQGATTYTGELAGFLAGLAQSPRTAVDLGCGTGADAVFLALQGIATSGVDLSATALERARDRATQSNVDVTWLRGDVLDLPIDDASMDLVLDRGCLHHVAVADQARYAAEVARILRPGGSLLVREMNQAGHHAHAVSEVSLRAMVEDTPLHVRSVVRYDPAAGGHAAATLLVVMERTGTSDV